MSSEPERLRAEFRQARKEANQNAWGIIFLLVVIACGVFGAVGTALYGLIIPALVIGAIVCCCLGLLLVRFA
jgi:hypothetical protein